MNSEAVEAVVAASASKATYGGAFTTGLGLLLGVAGLLVNLYFRHRQDRRDEREHTLRVRIIERDARQVACRACNEQRSEN